MDQLPDGQHVWLRSRAHGTYLHADEDGYGVSLSGHAASMNAAWVVHRWVYYGEHQYILLYSAAYGRYLSATTASAPVGCPGFRVAQRNYDDLEDEALRWEPAPIVAGADILLRHHVAGVEHDGHLRANARSCNVVTVDDFDNNSDMMHWVVEPIPRRERLPHLPRPTAVHLPDLGLSREVMFIGNGRYANDISFPFRGRSVCRLRDELASRLGIPSDVSNNLVMYVRAGRYGRFTPLVVNLPRSRETLVITADTPGDSSHIANIGMYLYETLMRGGVHLASSMLPDDDFMAQSAGHFRHSLPVALRPLARPGDLKTVVCDHWARSGSCPFGSDCWFAHGPDELEQILVPMAYKTKICRFGLQCPYGWRCFYQH